MKPVMIAGNNKDEETSNHLCSVNWISQGLAVVKWLQKRIKSLIMLKSGDVDDDGVHTSACRWNDFSLLGI